MTMLENMHRMLADPATLAREALGLVGLCVAILAALFLPILA
jgi:hypothetical protein